LPPRKLATPVNTSALIRIYRCGTLESHKSHNETPGEVGTISLFRVYEDLLRKLCLFVPLRVTLRVSALTCLLPPP
jgi:hypothetical protein